MIGELGTVHADPTQMRQLLQNLIENAIKFRGSEPPAVNVYVEQLPDGCRLIVEDNGIGFATEHAERIFDPFERLHARGVYEGTGIGLALCRRIMERHGGTIHAVSRAKVGPIRRHVSGTTKGFMTGAAKQDDYSSRGR